MSRKPLSAHIASNSKLLKHPSSPTATIIKKKSKTSVSATSLSNHSKDEKPKKKSASNSNSNHNRNSAVKQPTDYIIVNDGIFCANTMTERDHYQQFLSNVRRQKQIQRKSFLVKSQVTQKTVGAGTSKTIVGDSSLKNVLMKKGKKPVKFKKLTHEEMLSIMTLQQKKEIFYKLQEDIKKGQQQNRFQMYNGNQSDPNTSTQDTQRMRAQKFDQLEQKLQTLKMQLMFKWQAQIENIESLFDNNKLSEKERNSKVFMMEKIKDHKIKILECTRTLFEKILKEQQYQKSHEHERNNKIQAILQSLHSIPSMQNIQSGKDSPKKPQSGLGLASKTKAKSATIKPNLSTDQVQQSPQPQPNISHLLKGNGINTINKQQTKINFHYNHPQQKQKQQQKQEHINELDDYISNKDKNQYKNRANEEEESTYQVNQKMTNEFLHIQPHSYHLPKSQGKSAYLQQQNSSYALIQIENTDVTQKLIKGQQNGVKDVNGKNNNIKANCVVFSQSQQLSAKYVNFKDKNEDQGGLLEPETTAATATLSNKAIEIDQELNGQQQELQEQVKQSQNKLQLSELSPKPSQSQLSSQQQNCSPVSLTVQQESSSKISLRLDLRLDQVVFGQDQYPQNQYDQKQDLDQNEDQQNLNNSNKQSAQTITVPGQIIQVDKDKDIKPVIQQQSLQCQSQSESQSQIQCQNQYQSLSQHKTQLQPLSINQYIEQKQYQSQKTTSLQVKQRQQPKSRQFIPSSSIEKFLQQPDPSSLSKTDGFGVKGDEGPKQQTDDKVQTQEVSSVKGKVKGCMPSGTQTALDQCPDEFLCLQKPKEKISMNIPLILTQDKMESLQIDRNRQFKEQVDKHIAFQLGCLEYQDLMPTQQTRDEDQGKSPGKAPTNPIHFTTLVDINDYIVGLYEFMQRKYMNNLVDSLNMPYGKSVLDKLYSLMTVGEVEQEQFNNLNNIFSQRNFKEYQKQFTLTSRKVSEAESFHNRAVFDAFNKCINEYKPYYELEGEVYPWVVSEKGITFYEINDENIGEVFEKSKIKVLEYCALLCGVIPPQDCRNAQQKAFISQKVEETTKKMMKIDVLNMYNDWQIRICNSQCFVRMSLANKIFQQEINKAIEQISLIGRDDMSESRQVVRE